MLNPFRIGWQSVSDLPVTVNASRQLDKYFAIIGVSQGLIYKSYL